MSASYVSSISAPIARGGCADRSGRQCVDRGATAITFVTSQECGDILTSNALYSFRICDTGYWTITTYDTKGNPTDLATGYVAAQIQHTLVATDTGKQQSFSIDGAIVGSITDGDYLTTDRIALAIDAGPASNGVGTLAFSNFVFTPLP